MFPRALLLAIAAVVWPAVLATAQTQPPAPVPRFDTDIVVTPERGETARPLVPASTAVVDAMEIAGLPAAHVSEVASFLPGFSMMRAAYHAGRPVVSARGFFGGGEADYILLLLDGVPVSDVESGLVDWSLVPTTSVQRIEAFRGPGASLYGDSAIGGVVQILTNRGAGSRVNATGGSFATFTADATHGGRTSDVGFFASGAARRTDGAFDFSGGHQVLGAVSADGSRRGFSWRLNGSGEDRQRDDPGSLTREAAAIDSTASDPTFRFDGFDRHGFSTALTLRHDALGVRPQGRAYVSARDEDTIRTILLAPRLGDRRARRLDSLAIGGSFEGERAYASHRGTVRFGLDLARERLDTAYHGVTPTGEIGALDTDVTGRRVRTGAYVSSSWTASQAVRLYGALRWDDVDDEGFGDDAVTPERKRAWSPRAGVSVQLTDNGVAAYFQASRAFKAPTLDQLFDPRPYPDFMGGTFTISNRTLVPQRATNVEAGISGAAGAGNRSVRWSALAYRMNVDDEIDFDVQTFSYANIGRSTHTGIELEAATQWGRYVRPAATYALVRVLDEETGRQLKNVPRHVVSVSADLLLPWSLNAHARFQRTDGAFLDDEHAFPIEGAATLDVRVRRSLRRHTVFVDVLNATGDEYEEYGYALADFTGGSVPYVYPGAPRAIRAGVAIAF